ncbi:MAG TPA: hypothetical protein VFM38_04855 [Candidatus Limnocylindrales bacterium]|nr:hypothetical protein [Candidatus Limnocylindrales bacterium]
MSREALDALEAWHTTTLALREATPWTAEWVRLRMIAQEQREAYEALVEGRSDTKIDAESSDAETATDPASGAKNAEPARG